MSVKIDIVDGVPVISSEELVSYIPMQKMMSLSEMETAPFFRFADATEQRETFDCMIAHCDVSSLISLLTVLVRS